MSYICILFYKLLELISILEIEFNLALHIFKISPEALQGSVTSKSYFFKLCLFFFKIITHISYLLLSYFLNFSILVSDNGQIFILTSGLISEFTHVLGCSWNMFIFSFGLFAGCFLYSRPYGFPHGQVLVPDWVQFFLHSTFLSIASSNITNMVIYYLLVKNLKVLWFLTKLTYGIFHFEVIISLEIFESSFLITNLIDDLFKLGSLSSDCMVELIYLHSYLRCSIAGKMDSSQNIGGMWSTWNTCCASAWG